MALSSKKRAVVLFFIIVLMLGFLSLRLYKLSCGNYSKQVLFGQYTRKIDVVSRDALIYDRNMRLISHSNDGFIILADPCSIKQNISDIAFELGKVCDGYTSTDIASILTSGQYIKLFCKRDKDISGLKNIEGIYVFDSFEEEINIAPHLIGYENSDGEGVCGMKKQCAELLKAYSTNVSATFLSNAMSSAMPDGQLNIEIGDYNDNNGVVLTIDKQLQSFIESLEGEYIDKGAVVVANVHTGEILAAASYPSYDSENVEQYLTSKRGELVNRITQTYTPGSVFKLVVAAAALEKNVNYAEFSYECAGSIDVEGSQFNCHKRDGHGLVELEQAFADSCNCYFIALGQKIGKRAIINTAEKMGIGESVQADFLQSKSANIPEVKDVSKTLLANISFGQGTLLLSVFDMVNVINSCATGYLPPLRIIKGIYEENSLKENTIGEQKRVLKAQTVEKLKSMMGKCVTQGTGSGAYVEGLLCGGKTATAQTGQKGQNNEEILHKWFCGIYPKSQPNLSIIVLCDGTGRTKALPAEIFGIVNKFVVNAGIVDF